MKIKIVTVFKTNNCGSFLQAWALQEQLSKTKNSICFSNYKNRFDSFVKTIDGFVPFEPKEWDEKFGDYIQLPTL